MRHLRRLTAAAAAAAATGETTATAVATAAVDCRMFVAVADSRFSQVVVSRLS
jgi:hypothetical protein